MDFILTQNIKVVLNIKMLNNGSNRNDIAWLKQVTIPCEIWVYFVSVFMKDPVLLTTITTATTINTTCGFYICKVKWLCCHQRERMKNVLQENIH